MELLFILAHLNLQCGCIAEISCSSRDPGRGVTFQNALLYPASLTQGNEDLCACTLWT